MIKNNALKEKKKIAFCLKTKQYERTECLSSFFPNAPPGKK